MAIFKVVVKENGAPVGHATPHKLEEYLKSREGNMASAINADAEHFSDDCQAYAALHGTCQRYDDLKYKHYVQSFPPEDCKKMTRERCHELGLEVARTFWKDFPVLVVTHYEQEVEGTGEFHWHNHFLVYNSNIKTGRKINTTVQELWSQKRFIAAQADNNHLTRKGLILENGRIRESQQEVKYTARKHNKVAPISGSVFLSQKADLRLAIISAIANTDNYEDFCAYLDKKHHIKTKESRGALGFLHPDRRGQARAWVRGKTLGEAYTKEAIINEYDSRRRRLENDTPDQRGERYKQYIEEHTGDRQLEYYKKFIDELYGNNTPKAQGSMGAVGESKPDSGRRITVEGSTHEGRGGFTAVIRRDSKGDVESNTSGSFASSAGRDQGTDIPRASPAGGTVGPKR